MTRTDLLKHLVGKFEPKCLPETFENMVCDVLQETDIAGINIHDLYFEDLTQSQLNEIYDALTDVYNNWNYRYVSRYDDDGSDI